MMKTRFAVALAVPALLSLLAFADWQVGPDSRVQFVSIKNNTIGEVSHFEILSGSVTDAGEVEVRVVLDSVETNVGIRNERMKAMLFEVGLYPEAVITTQLDAGSMAVLSGGGLTNVALQIDLHGQTVTKNVQLSVAVSDQGVNATTTQPILLSAADFGLEGGVAALQEVAGLNAISRVIPVTVALQLVPAS
ncbi:MAG: YceI family protein [Pseudomonadota bacterium]|nr:YceI family protein [Pseudomonadota bacterium]